MITSIDDASAGIGSQRGALLVPLAGSCAPYCRLGARETRSSTLARPVHPLIQFSPLSFPAGSLRGRDLGPKQAGHSGRPLSASLTDVQRPPTTAAELPGHRPRSGSSHKQARPVARPGGLQARLGPGRHDQRRFARRVDRQDQRARAERNLGPYRPTSPGDRIRPPPRVAECSGHKEARPRYAHSRWPGRPVYTSLHVIEPPATQRPFSLTLRGWLAGQLIAPGTVTKSGRAWLGITAERVADASGQRTGSAWLP